MVAAASHLEVTHGTVSRRVKDAEHWLGIPIFDRLGRGVRLTIQGRMFVRRAERSLAGLASIRTELISQRTRDVVRISALPSFARLWLLPRLRRLETELGGGTIEIISEHRLARLDEKEADIAVRYGLGNWSGMHSELLFGDRVKPAASPSLAHSLAGCSSRELLGQTLLFDGDGADWREWFASSGVAYTSQSDRRRFTDYDITIAAAREGLGIVLLRLPLAADSLNDGSLCELDVPDFSPQRGHHLVSRINESHPRTIRAISAIKRLASVEPDVIVEDP